MIMVYIIGAIALSLSIGVLILMWTPVSIVVAVGLSGILLMLASMDENND